VVRRPKREVGLSPPSK